MRKTGSRNPNLAWAVSRFHIYTQFRGDIATKKKELEGTLFVDEHTEFCQLGEKGHHGQSNRVEWRAHMLDDEFCHERDGGELEPQNLQRKPKNPSRADGIFGVCSPMPLGGRRRRTTDHEAPLLQGQGHWHDGLR